MTPLQVPRKSMTIILSCAFVLAAQDISQIEKQKTIPPLSHSDSSHRMMDRGAIGSPVQKASRPFKGEIETPLGQVAPGLRGASQRKPSHQADQNAADQFVGVTLQPSGKADLVEATQATPALHLKNAGHASPKYVSVFLDPRAQMISPVNGSVLAPVQTFTWTPGYDVDEYYLWMGSCYDCTDLLNESEATNLSRTVNLPSDGRIIYVTLFSHVQGNWYWFDYQFVASTNTGVPATLITPGNGATLGSPQTFTWTAGYGVSDYQLWIGTCQDCTDILGEDEGRNLSRTVNLPVNGETIFATLYSLIGNSWYWYDYQFTAGTGHPVHINITNQLGYPLNIFVNGSAIGSVSAFNTQGGDVVVAGSMSVAFRMIQPSLNGNALGDGVSGYWNTINNPSGTYNLLVTNQLGNDWYFMPLITNQSAAPLEIEVNGGLQAENRCNCFAPAYTNNVATGYYQLFSNSNVRLFLNGDNYTGPYEFFGTDANGQIAPSGPLYTLVASGSGIVNLDTTFAP